MSAVTNKREQFSAADPRGRQPDPWAAFREIEIIDLAWSQQYRHSLGKYSRFFLALEEQRFLATACAACGKVWSPPRPVCPDCLQITAWRELSGRGTLVSWSVLHYAPKMLAASLETPYVLGYVRLDGADTCFAHLLRGVGDGQDLQHGMRVRVVYPPGPVDHPIMLMAFEVDEEG